MQARAAEAGRGGSSPTLVLLLARGGHYACLWAGDSRAYRLRDGRLERLTRDHSLVQELVEQGVLDEEAAEQHPQANVITRAVGAHGELELDKVSARVAPGDVFLCSDGVFNGAGSRDCTMRRRQGAARDRGRAGARRAGQCDGGGGAGRRRLLEILRAKGF